MFFLFIVDKLYLFSFRTRFESSSAIEQANQIDLRPSLTALLQHILPGSTIDDNTSTEPIITELKLEQKSLNQGDTEAIASCEVESTKSPSSLDINISIDRTNMEHLRENTEKINEASDSLDKLLQSSLATISPLNEEQASEIIVPNTTDERERPLVLSLNQQENLEAVETTDRSTQSTGEKQTMHDHQTTGFTASSTIVDTSATVSVDQQSINEPSSIKIKDSQESATGENIVDLVQENRVQSVSDHPSTKFEQGQVFVNFERNNQTSDIPTQPVTVGEEQQSLLNTQLRLDRVIEDQSNVESIVDHENVFPETRYLKHLL